MPRKRKTSANSSGPPPPAGGELGALARGRQHYARREWAEAYGAILLADREAPLGVDDLERLASSAGLSGRNDELVKTLERVYHALEDARECERAARTAFWLGFRLSALGELGRAGGWLARAQRLVEREEKPSVVEGYLLLPVVRRHFAAGEYEAALHAAEKAAAIGDRFAEVDLSVFARNLQGRILLQQGKIDPGFALIDEAMLAVMNGELSPVITGLIYCSAIDSCSRIYALDRAREWTSALARWCDAQPQLVTFTSACLLHRAELLQLDGAWLEASAEARRASEPSRTTAEPQAAGGAFYQQGEVLRLRGDFAQAEEAFRSASQLGREPQPGLALLRLAQGHCDAAASSIRRVVGAAKTPLERARLLPACVDILLAAGDLEEARRASKELEATASAFGMDVLGAIAAHARGTVQLAEGDSEGALGSLRNALKVWQQVGLPYHAARTRVALARACRALRDEDSAGLELDAAREAFERLGAAPDAAAAVALAKRATPAPSHGLTGREIQVLRLVAAGKTNKAIAHELCLSEKTIDRHVSNIFGKVNVSSRAAATAFAYENGLV